MYLFVFKDIKLLEEICRILGKKSRECLYLSKNEVVLKPVLPKMFSRFLFVFGSILFCFLIGIQYFISVVDYPQPMSGKPNFHLVVAIPFAFEVTLLFVGIILFIRFFLVSFSFMSTIPKSVQNEAKNLSDDDVLVAVPDEYCLVAIQILDNYGLHYVTKKVID